MEGKGFLIVIHLHVAMIFGDCFSDTLYAKTVFTLIGLCGGKPAV